MMGHLRAALTRTWWVHTEGMTARLDRVIHDELTAIAGPPPPPPPPPPPSVSTDCETAIPPAAAAGRTVDLFEATSRAVLRAGIVAFLGERFNETYGYALWRGLRDWQLAAWVLPWILFPRTARRGRPAMAAAHAAAFGPVADHVAAVMAGEAEAEPGTYLADMMDSLRSSGVAAEAKPVHVATQIFGVLTAMHINTYATGAWTVAHVAADASLTAEVKEEVAALRSGHPHTTAANGGGGGPSPTGLPVLDAVWAEVMRVHQTAPSVRVSRAPFHVPASTKQPATAAAAAAVAPGNGDSGDRRNAAQPTPDHPGWTVPGDGRLVALSILDANRGADYYTDGDVFHARRFLAPGGQRWQAAMAARRLFSFAWGPHGCIGRRVAEVTLQRLWLRLYTDYDVRLAGAPGGRRGGQALSGKAAIPPPDFLHAAATAVPVRPVYVQLTHRQRQKDDAVA